ncbi:MAG: MMPL family transporter, partial [Verrucomicrobiota bacterium]
LRSVRLGAVAMLGNLFPIVVFFGFLSLIGESIDIATMMIAAVAFGIAVDDTVHFLTWLQRGLARKEGVEEAVRFAYQRSAGAILQTTLIISLGMLAFCLSDFQPAQRFALFSAAVLVLAMWGDLLWLPALLQGPFRRWFEPKTP